MSSLGLKPSVLMFQQFTCASFTLRANLTNICHEWRNFYLFKQNIITRTLLKKLAISVKLTLVEYQLGRNKDIVSNKEFKSVNHTLDKMMKAMTKTGASRYTQHKWVIDSDDLK